MDPLHVAALTTTPLFIWYFWSRGFNRCSSENEFMSWFEFSPLWFWFCSLILVLVGSLFRFWSHLTKRKQTADRNHLCCCRFGLPAKMFLVIFVFIFLSVYCFTCRDEQILRHHQHERKRLLRDVSHLRQTSWLSGWMSRLTSAALFILTLCSFIWFLFVILLSAPKLQKQFEHFVFLMSVPVNELSEQMS